MDFTLLSGVVRNRKVYRNVSSSSNRVNDPLQTDNDSTPAATNQFQRILNYLKKSSLFRKFNLRVHKFSFQWDLVLHLSVCILSLTPFFFTGRRVYSILPLGVWAFYNILFLIGHNANLVIPKFAKFRHSFKSAIEDFFSPKLLPVLSVSFLLVVLSLSVTGHRLGGPPLCYRSCGMCLSSWRESEIVDSSLLDTYDSYRIGCGYVNGKELLGYYTMAQTSFLLFLTVVVAMAVCLAWRVADEEKTEREAAEDWLKLEKPKAFSFREQIIKKYGSPASSIRPEGGVTWVFFGVVAALSFTLLGWHNWYVLPPSHTATLLIILNLLTILMTTLILHLGFFGRLLALYKRNYKRVEELTGFLKEKEGFDIDSWWNCRNFVLNDDLSLDYDIGGLAVSATFLINVLVFLILLVQVSREGGHNAIMESPGNYCAYAGMYITSCLIKLFTLATNTYEEQHKHISALHQLSLGFYSKPSGGIFFPEEEVGSPPWAAEDQYNQDDGPLDIDEDLSCSVPLLARQGSGSGQQGSATSPMSGLTLSSSTSVKGVHSPRRTGKEGRKNLMTASRSTSRSAKRLGLGTPTAAQGTGLIEGKSGEPAAGGLNNGNIVGVGKSEGNIVKALGTFDASEVFESFEESRVLQAEKDSIGEKVEIDVKMDFFGSVFPSSFKGAFFGFESKYTNKNQSSGDLENNKKSQKVLTIDPNEETFDLENPEEIPDQLSPYTISPKRKTQTLTQTQSSPQTPDPNESKSRSRPDLTRSQSTNLESQRQAIAEIIDQIREYDPYPCIFGIPVMPALFTWSKFYIFFGFILCGVRTMISCFRQI